MKWHLKSTEPKEIRPRFITFQNASYTVEMEKLLCQSALKNVSVQKEFFALRIPGRKG